MALREAVVAFIDILGFGSLIDRAEADQDVADQLSTALHNIGTFQDALTSDEIRGDVKIAGDTHVSVFSDSVVISASGDNALNSVIVGASGLYADLLLNHGLPCRGGIATGWLHHEGGILYGRAVMNAYALESQVAFYPRIIVDRQLATEQQVERYSFFVSYDPDDGFWYVDPFRMLLSEGISTGTLETIMTELARGMAAARHNPKHAAKWWWLCHRLRDVALQVAHAQRDTVIAEQTDRAVQGFFRDLCSRQEIERQADDPSQWQPRLLDIATKRGLVTVTDGRVTLTAEFTDALLMQSTKLCESDMGERLSELWTDTVITAVALTKHRGVTVTETLFAEIVNELIVFVQHHAVDIARKCGLIADPFADGWDALLGQIRAQLDATTAAPLPELLRCCRNVVNRRLAMDAQFARWKNFVAAFLFHVLVLEWDGGGKTTNPRRQRPAKASNATS